MKNFNSCQSIWIILNTKLVAFVTVSVILVGAMYSSSVFIAFGAISCKSTPRNPADTVCFTTDSKGKYTKVEYCYVDKNGDPHCITVYQALTGDIPPDLRDAISKAQGVEPDVSSDERGNNDEEPPNDLGGFNNDEEGPSVNPGE